MNLEITNEQIEESFDRIASDLLRNYALFVNYREFRFTEIEFYYFHETHHPDKYTHEHNRSAGEWQFHNQGLDLTLQSTKESDGGILLRGILAGDKFINGPRKVLTEIFQSFGDAFKPTDVVLKQTSKRDVDVYKTFRHLPNKSIVEEYHNKPYRYLTDLDKLDIPASIKNEMQKYQIKL